MTLPPDHGGWGGDDALDDDDATRILAALSATLDAPLDADNDGDVRLAVALLRSCSDITKQYARVCLLRDGRLGARWDHELGALTWVDDPLVIHRIQRLFGALGFEVAS